MGFRVEQFEPKLILYRHVANASEIRQCIFRGDLRCAIVKPKLIVDEFQVRVAVHNALMRAKYSSSKTRSVYTEVIYSLSGSKKISDSLKTFGIGDNDTDVLVIIPEDQDQMEETKISNLIKGDKTPLSELAMITDQAAVKKLFKIKEDELRLSTLGEAVVTRMSSKEVCNF